MTFEERLEKKCNSAWDAENKLTALVESLFTQFAFYHTHSDEFNGTYAKNADTCYDVLTQAREALEAARKLRKALYKASKASKAN